MSQIQNLKDLRNKLAGRKMSLLVGAGFSKNVSPNFPDWAELLNQLVYELYRDEIDEQIPAGIEEKESKIAIREQVKKIIQKIGYLKVVSNFIASKGYEESIVDYIEQHTPIELSADRDYYLINEEGEKEKLTEDKLHLHKLLLTFPWNNVFTTNYDPLLEASVDVQLHAKLQDENKRLSESINEISNLLVEARQKEAELEKRSEDLENRISSDRLGRSPIEDSSGQENRNEEKESISRELEKLYRQIEQYNADIATKQQAFAVNDAQADNCYTLVTSGPELSLKKHKNIIKLHGSLRSLEDRINHKFGFDQDPRKQYIISAEHYDQYPKKHEAFTQLMRIALLQESFCLIGFSGVDPNFTAWIGWVRDLLYRSAMGAQDRDYKIYLVEVSEEKSVPVGRQLYFENHRIAAVNLLSEEVIQFLEKETKQYLDTNNKKGSALQLLFNFLAAHEAISTPIAPIDSAGKRKWQEGWRSITTMLNESNSIDEKKLNEQYQVMVNLASEDTFPELSRNSAYDQYSFLYNFNSIGFRNLSNAGKSKMLELLVRLAPQLHVPIGRVVAPDVLNTITVPASIERRLTALTKVDQLLNDPQGEVSEEPLHKMLQLAFSMDFESLRKHLLEWQPEWEDTHIKAGFLAQFDNKAAVNLLEVQLASGRISDQQKMFSYELQLAIKMGESWQRHNKLRAQIEKYRQAGYVSFSDTIEHLVDTISEQQPETLPYGKSRFSTSPNEKRHHPFETFTPSQVLSLLITYGFPVQVGMLSMLTRERWYKLFKAGFETFPFPFTYYAIQYEHENIQRRIGQDLAWSDKINDQKQRIVTNLFRAFFSHTESVMILLSELFIAVPPPEWEKEFAQTCKKLQDKGTMFEPHNNVCDTYIKSGLQFVEDSGIMYAIILELLRNLPEKASKVITYLYYTNANKILLKSERSGIPKALTQHIDSMIEHFKQNSSDKLFAFANTNYLLTDKQRDAIYQQLRELDFLKIRNNRALRLALFFAKNDSEVTDRIEQAILQHPDLWATGINGNSISGGHLTVALLDFTIRNNPKYGLRFNKEELAIIYEKLKTALKDISRVSPTRTSLFVDFTGMIHDMCIFLKHFKDDLVDQPDYDTILSEATNLYANYTGYKDLIEGLDSSERVSVIWALADLSEEIEHGSFNDEAVQLMMTKVLLQAGPSVEACLTYLASWVNDGKVKLEFKKYAKTLIRILKKFKAHMLHESDKPFVEQVLVKIAYALQSLGMNDPIITTTLEDSNIKYNNSRQWLKARRMKADDE